jgi:phosphonate transport system substrate-binding protein
MKLMLVLLLMIFLAGCGKSGDNAHQPSFSAIGVSNTQEYLVGIHPLHNPRKLFEVYGPIVDILNATVPGAHFTLEASRNYEEFDKKLVKGYFDFAMPNPYQTVRSLQYGYHVFGKMADDDKFRGIVLVRKDSGIKSISDLKGQKVAYPALTALAATMMPQYYFQTHGLDVNRDIVNVYVGSQESSIINVYLGQVAAGATWPVPWEAFIKEHPDMARQLEVKWQTEPLVNNGWVVRNDVSPLVAEDVALALFNLTATEQGRAILERLPISKFEPASNETFYPVRNYLERFSREVRNVEW